MAVPVIFLDSFFQISRNTQQLNTCKLPLTISDLNLSPPIEAGAS